MLNEEVQAVRDSILDTVQNIKLILMAIRELAGELAFTLAAFYGFYEAFIYLVRAH
jgi:hypothetical protein